VLVLVPEAHQEQRQDVHDVRLEQPTEAHVEQLERHQRALARLGVGFVLHRGFHRVHHPEQFQRPDAHALHRAGQPERRAPPLGVPGAARDLRQQALHQRAALVLVQRLRQGRQAVRDGALHRLGRRGQDVHQPREDAARARVILLQMPGERAEEHGDALARVIRLRVRQSVARAATARRAVEVPLIHAEELLHVLRAVQLDHRAPAAHRGVANGFVLVRQHLGQERGHQRQVLGGERGRRRAERAHERRAALRVARELLRRELVGEARALGHHRALRVRIRSRGRLGRCRRVRGEELRQRGRHAAVHGGGGFREGVHRGVARARRGVPEEGQDRQGGDVRGERRHVQLQTDGAPGAVGGGADGLVHVAARQEQPRRRRPPGLLRAAEDQVAKRARLELGERGERRRADRAELGLESVQERVRDVRSLGRERAGGDVQEQRPRRRRRRAGGGGHDAERQARGGGARESWHARRGVRREHPHGAFADGRRAHDVVREGQRARTQGERQERHRRRERLRVVHLDALAQGVQRALERRRLRRRARDGRRVRLERRRGAVEAARGDAQRRGERGRDAAEPERDARVAGDVRRRDDERLAQRGARALRQDGRRRKREELGGHARDALRGGAAARAPAEHGGRQPQPQAQPVDDVADARARLRLLRELRAARELGFVRDVRAAASAAASPAGASPARGGHLARAERRAQGDRRGLVVAVAVLSRTRPAPSRAASWRRWRRRAPPA
jgi:hypothetical protein